MITFEGERMTETDRLRETVGDIHTKEKRKKHVTQCD